LGLLLLASVDVPAAPAAAPKRVLVLHSYGQDFVSYSDLPPAFRDELTQRLGEPMDLVLQVANRYVREFEETWVRGGAPAGEVLVGSADVQSLADMGNSYAIVQSMKSLPVGKDDFLRVIAAIVLS
jgi:hypothetical protein